MGVIIKVNMVEKLSLKIMVVVNGIYYFVVILLNLIEFLWKLIFIMKIIGSRL